MLKCNIDANTNHIHEGLALGMVDDRERQSQQLGRTALFKGSSVSPPERGKGCVCSDSWYIYMETCI